MKQIAVIGMSKAQFDKSVYSNKWRYATKEYVYIGSIDHIRGRTFQDYIVEDTDFFNGARLNELIEEVKTRVRQ